MCVHANAPQYLAHTKSKVFTNFLRDSDLEALAKADQNSLVDQVQEFFADYFAVNNDTFSFNYPNFIYNNKVGSWQQCRGSLLFFFPLLLHALVCS